MRNGIGELPNIRSVNAKIKSFIDKWNSLYSWKGNQLYSITRHYLFWSRPVKVFRFFPDVWRKVFGAVADCNWFIHA